MQKYLLLEVAKTIQKYQNFYAGSQNNLQLKERLDTIMILGKTANTLPNGYTSTEEFQEGQTFASASVVQMSPCQFSPWDGHLQNRLY